MPVLDRGSSALYARRHGARFRTLNTVVVAALATAGIAAAAAGDARPCHPDLPGTRSLTMTGEVTGYRFAVEARSSPRSDQALCRRRPLELRGEHEGERIGLLPGIERGRFGRGATTVGRGAGRPPRPSRARARRLDRPDRLDVVARATGRRISSWPLIDRPARVVLFGKIAIFSAASRNALYALRISDGRIAMLGVAHSGDRPIIGREGVVYQTGLSLKAARLTPNRTTLKLVPLASVERQLTLADRPIQTHWRISAIGMDGRRLAFAVHDPAGRCDVVKFWIFPWHYVARVTHPSAATCVPGHGAGGVTNVAMAADRLVWTTRYGNRTRGVLLVHPPSVARSGSLRGRLPVRPVAALAGDGSVLAYALSGAVGLVSNDEPTIGTGKVLSRSAVPIAAISADSGRIATLYRDGTVTVMSAHGDLVSRFSAGPARAIALRAGTGDRPDRRAPRRLQRRHGSPGSLLAGAGRTRARSVFATGSP